MSNYWLIPFGLAAEAGGVSLLLTSSQTMEAVATYAVLHALACSAFTLVLLVFMPQRYRTMRFLPGLFLFCLQFAIPVIGSIGVFSGVLLALYLPRLERDVPWQIVEAPELPYKPLDLDSMVTYTEGGLRQVLREAKDPDKRLKALLATRQMAGPEPVDLLRSALKDPADDVRLLAYSMLEQREKSLVSEASELQAQLKNKTSDKHQERAMRRLGQIWWEMVYLGLAQGGLRQYYLEQAREVLVTLVGKFDRHQDWRLLGRIELEMDNPVQAGEAFEVALENGCSPESVYPYLAEVAFLARDFSRVRYLLARCPQGRSHPSLVPLFDSWLS